MPKGKGEEMKKLSKEATKLKKAILKEYAITDDAGISILQTAMEAFDLMHGAQTVVDKQGLTVAGDRGGIKAHPCCLSFVMPGRNSWRV